ncbi:MAG: prolipoprotein diacylglyceryl transferase [Rhodovibrionaceae bacterium]|nr:prolipoprotein diacylglyceryl transferase [Rhodovibrionaceae bacterium]
MPFAVIDYPQIDPVLIEFGPFAVRWYALAYVAGLILGWRYARALAERSPWPMRREDFDDLLFWATIGVLLGGRLGYVLFYKPGYYLSNPAEILFLWEGGMAFHGGAAGVILALILFSLKRGLPMVAVGDIVSAAAPIGLFFGRVANFINGELWGRTADVPWAMVFPGAGPQPRHPSQLYEAGLEGLVLFIVLLVMIRMGALGRQGAVAGVFLAGYGLSRFVVEYFREPDAHLGFLAGGLTMGQLLSLPMILAGIGFLVFALRASPAKPADE